MIFILTTCLTDVNATSSFLTIKEPKLNSVNSVTLMGWKERTLANQTTGTKGFDVRTKQKEDYTKT